MSQVPADEDARDPVPRTRRTDQPHAGSGRHAHAHPNPTPGLVSVSGPGLGGQGAGDPIRGRAALTNLAPAQAATPIPTRIPHPRRVWSVAQDPADDDARDPIRGRGSLTNLAPGQAATPTLTRIPRPSWAWSVGQVWADKAQAIQGADVPH